MENKQIKYKPTAIGLTSVLTISLTIVSYYGAFISGTYVHEATSFAVQGMGQDVFDLFFVVPILVISFVYAIKGNKAGFFIYGGTLFYILYSFFIYSFGVHFNKLFLLYCITLGTSLYAFILLLYRATIDFKLALSPRAPIRSITIYFFLIAILFYLLWFKDIISALLNNSVPSDIAENYLLVNPIHVLDIAIALPGLIVSAILLKYKHPIGILLTPIFLVFTILLAMALVAMGIMLQMKDVSEDLAVAGVFIVLAGISTFFLVGYLRNITVDKRKND